MSNPFVAEIKLAGFNFAPSGWATCQGQILPISQYTALFSLIGTYYGGNGTSNFALPNLSSRAALGPDLGGTYSIGEQSGTENVTLTLSEYPAHNHSVGVFSGLGEAGRPTDHYLASTQAATGGGVAGPNLYGAPVALTALNPSVLPAYVGSSQPHENRQPFLAMEYIIALQGIYPSRN